MRYELGPLRRRLPLPRNRSTSGIMGAKLAPGIMKGYLDHISDRGTANIRRSWVGKVLLPA
jgi:hypothetical protein